MEKKYYETRTFDTPNYGVIECVYNVDEDGEVYYEMYDLMGGYYGQLRADNIDNLDVEDVEETIAENLYN